MEEEQGKEEEKEEEERERWRASSIRCVFPHGFQLIIGFVPTGNTVQYVGILTIIDTNLLQSSRLGDLLVVVDLAVLGVLPEPLPGQGEDAFIPSILSIPALGRWTDQGQPHLREGGGGGGG